MYYVALSPVGGDALVKPVRPLYASYLRESVYLRFQPLSDEQYLDGPIGILSTPAPFTYILDSDAINLCIEWQPGLLVIQVGLQTTRWAARRSPNPQFAGRHATATEIETFMKWEGRHIERPPQYGIIFDAWDDIVEQSFDSWQPASHQQNDVIGGVVDRLDKLYDRVPKDSDAYREQVEKWRRSDFWNMRWEDFD
jgi:hypothetical protein